MIKISTILAAVDLGEPSLNALNTAASLAEKNNASLHIIHVKDNIFEFIGADVLKVSTTSNHSSNILTALANDIQRKHKIKPVIIEEEGFATQAILKHSVKSRCDLVVMGSYGASGYRDGFIGTNAHNMIKYAPCPVLIIPAGKNWVTFKKVLFPIRPVIAGLRHYDILRNFLSAGASLEVLGLSSGQAENRKELDKQLADIRQKMQNDKITAIAEWDEGTFIPENVLRRADQNNADLLVITPSIDVSAKQFYIGPNAHRIMHQAKIPLLSINRANVYASAELRLS